MNHIKKTLFTLVVDGYSKEICNITFPLLRKYAEKIDADFYIITERKWPKMPPVYEKLQIFDLGRAMRNDWNIYIDADALVHPETIDFTTQVHKDTVLHNGHDMANVRWRYDEYFLRDGRNIGSCNWLTIASDWCIDLWRPLDIPYEQALRNIYPIPSELGVGITKEHLIDDYALSRNIAKYGLKFMGIMDLVNNVTGPKDAYFFHHQYTLPIEEKIIDLKKVIKGWGL